MSHQRRGLFILAGATWPDRLLAALGAGIAIALTGLLCALAEGGDGHTAAIAGPIGASALLVFVIPASPLAQPWPVIAGNTLSAFIGLVAAFLIPEQALAIGIAVGLAILAMSASRSLHPPSAAMALTAALLGPAGAPMGWLFPLMPVLANSALLVALGLAFHRLRGHPYPHHASHPVPERRTGIETDDIDAALAEMGETFDIDRDDLEDLLRRIETRVQARRVR